MTHEAMTEVCSTSRCYVTIQHEHVSGNLGAVRINLVLTLVEHPLATSAPSPSRWIFIDEFPGVCQKNFICYIDQVSNNVFNRTRRRRYVSTHYPPVLPPPSLTTSRPGPSIFIDGRSEGSSTAYNYALHSTGKDICGQSRRMSFASYLNL